MSYSATVLADSPVGYWRLGEASGTSAADTSGNSRTGTYSGTYTQGVQGIPGVSGNTAVTFTGTAGAQVSVPWNAAFTYTTTGSLTVEFWCKGTAVGSNAGSGTVGSTCGLITASTDASNKWWGVTLTDTGGIRFFYGSSYLIVTGAKVVNDGQWHHVVVTVTTGTSYTITVYVDGVVDVTTSAATASVGGGSPAVTIANNPRAATHVAPGTLDEVAIYPTALSAAKVATHYSVGSGTHAEMSYTVQLDVSGSAFGSAFTATDVTSKAVAGLGFEPVTITWGRQDQYGSVNPTTVSGEMLNSDGTFSPGNTSSTYYPYIRRGLRRRVSVGVNGTTLNLSEDYASSLEVVPVRDNVATTKIEGTDILGRFGATPSTSDPNSAVVGTMLRSFIAEEMLLDSPSCLFMLQEADGATSFGDFTGTCGAATVQNSALGAGTVTAGQTSTGTFYGGSFVNIDNPTYSTWASGNTSGSWLTFTPPDLSAYNTYTWEMWISTLTTPPHVLACLLSSQAPGWGPQLAINLNGKVVFTPQGGGTLTSTANVCDGLVHHIVATLNGSTISLYVDGTLQATGAAGVGAAGPPSTNLVQIGATSLSATPNKPLEPYSGGVAYVALYINALSSTRITAHYQSGATVFAGERTDQRIARLLSYRANTGSSLDTGLGTMGIQSISGRSLQDCLLEVAQVEAGVVFVDGTGRVIFRSRSRLFNPTPTVTLDMSAGGVDFGSNWREDTQNVINDATVTNSSTGSDQRVYNTSSIAADGAYSTSYSVPLNADTDALNLAGWTVANGTQQQLTATPLVVNLLHVTAAQAQALLQLKPLDCLQITNCPTPAPSSTMTFIVQGGTTSLASDSASLTLNVTPLPYPVAVWDTTTWDAPGVTWAF